MHHDGQGMAEEVLAHGCWRGVRAEGMDLHGDAWQEDGELGP